MANPILGRCPVCGEALQVTELQCRECDTTIQGRFELGPFQRLTAEQLAFVETFIRCEGKITRVEQELGLSYPTVRNRLNEAIRALGYEVEEEEEFALSPEERQAILERLAKGEISTDEAIELLRVR
ncbi:MAG: DUF2089 domain-containing protein [Chloroflexi bacterium]|nr:DUF2089 domain-containing protein [Chloroflexota bacterium]